MRTILFRGKLSYSDEWIEGSLLLDENKKPYIIPHENVELDGHHLRIDCESPFWVIPSTVGQYTTIDDKNGKMIFEGDIIRIEIPKREGGVNPPLIKICEVYYKDSSFYCTWGWRSDTNLDGFSYNVIFEIMGNIHDNLELIKSK